MSESLVLKRFTTPGNRAFVLFRIGMRFNGLRGIVPALRTFAEMPFMLAEQRSNPDIGMLATSVSLSWPVIAITQYWRSFDELERYALASAGKHTRAMRWFNKLGRSSEGTGIWHETYRIEPGTYESIYANMPPYGLAAAIGHEPIVPAKARARDRIEAA